MPLWRCSAQVHGQRLTARLRNPWGITRPRHCCAEQSQGQTEMCAAICIGYGDNSAERDYPDLRTGVEQRTLDMGTKDDNANECVVMVRSLVKAC